jgi:excinuclease ABC subunit B
MPEVSLVAILDADQEGFLRSERSLIQTVGRAARHIEGRAIFYADRITGSMQRCLDETNRRRVIQVQHNLEHGITPMSVKKSVDQVRFITRVADARMERDEEKGKPKRVAEKIRQFAAGDGPATIDIPAAIAAVEKAMREAAANLDFEGAARLRDELFELRARADGASTAKAKPAGVGTRRAAR